MDSLTKSSNLDRRTQNSDKFRKYMDVVEKFKTELDSSNKMSEEIKRLKEDRKKRLQAKEKEEIAYEQGRNDETFKKKNYCEYYYTPKYEKGSYRDRFPINKPIEPNRFVHS